MKELLLTITNENRFVYFQLFFLISWLVWFICKYELYKKMSRLFTLIVLAIFVPIVLIGGLLVSFLLLESISESYKIIYIIFSIFIFVFLGVSVLFILYNSLAENIDKKNKLPYIFFVRIGFLFAYIFSIILLGSGYGVKFFIFGIVGIIIFFGIILYFEVNLNNFFGINKINNTERLAKKEMREKNIKLPFIKRKSYFWKNLKK